MVAAQNFSQLTVERLSWANQAAGKPAREKIARIRTKRQEAGINLGLAWHPFQSAGHIEDTYVAVVSIAYGYDSVKELYQSKPLY